MFKGSCHPQTKEVAYANGEIGNGRNLLDMFILFDVILEESFL